jgi:hypothetical protein
LDDRARTPLPDCNFTDVNESNQCIGRNLVLVAHLSGESADDRADREALGWLIAGTTVAGLALSWVRFSHERPT